MRSISTLPPKPGVYIFRDRQGRALYVGKAVRLKERVESHFQKESPVVQKIAEVEHIETDSEIEALLLEANLIKKLKPKYNVKLRNGHAYKFVKISQAVNHRSSVAKVTTTKREDNPNAAYFGPFPEGKTIGNVLKTLRRIFPFADCSKTKFSRQKRLRRPCLFGDLKLCPSPCAGWITPRDYQRIVTQLIQFLKGRKRGLIENLKKEMKILSRGQQFEKAAQLRDRIYGLEYVIQKFRLPEDFVEVESPPAPRRIEAYDISNIAGQHAVGSMAVFINGRPEKSEYRRFRIKTVKAASDVAMLKEILRRRFQKAWPLPDLILVDGGKAQEGAALFTLGQFGLKIPVVALAKREEGLLRWVREEAHRFAINYHRKLRLKNMLN